MQSLPITIQPLHIPTSQSSKTEFPRLQAGSVINIIFYLLIYWFHLYWTGWYRITTMVDSWALKPVIHLSLRGRSWLEITAWFLPALTSADAENILFTSLYPFGQDLTNHQSRWALGWIQGRSTNTMCTCPGLPRFRINGCVWLVDSPEMSNTDTPF